MVGYKYLIGTGIFFVIWLSLFLYRKKLRKEMLVMGFIYALMGPLTSFLFLRDYWNPDYLFSIFGFGIEDILFGFFIGGIAAIIYEAFFIKKFRRVKKETNQKIFYLIIIGIILFFVLNLVFKLNTIYASSIGLVIIAIVILIQRKDLIKNAIASGILVTIIIFIFYLTFILIFPNIIETWWQLEKISGILLLGVPIEELLWGFSFGFLAGPFYEFWQGKRGIEYD